MKKKLLIVSMLLLFFVVGCQKQTAKQKGSLQIVTTFYAMYDFTQNVADRQDHVEMIIPAGVEPHDFEPSAKQVAKIVDSDVFIYNSKDMETWVPKVLENIDTKKTIVIDASEGVERIGKKNGGDPHIWLDPVLAQQEVKNIRDGLEKANEKQKNQYQKNADQYITKLQALDKKYRDALKDAKNRIFVTQHEAFSYLAKRYDLEQLAIAGLSPDIEPGPKTLARLKQEVKEKDIRVIYFEEMASSKVAETLAKETGAKLDVLNPLEGLSEKDQKTGLNYIKVMEKNLKNLQESIR